MTKSVNTPKQGSDRGFGLGLAPLPVSTMSKPAASRTSESEHPADEQWADSDANGYDYTVYDHAVATQASAAVAVSSGSVSQPKPKPASASEQQIIPGHPDLPSFVKQSYEQAGSHATAKPKDKKKELTAVQSAQLSHLRNTLLNRRSRLRDDDTASNASVTSPAVSPRSRV